MTSQFHQLLKALTKAALSASPVLLFSAKAAVPASLLTGFLSALAAELLRALPCLVISAWEAVQFCMYQLLFECLLHLLLFSHSWVQLLHTAL